ncbi:MULTISPECIES: site-specific DNA-methyltransferase [Algoriphagus]|uniref:site-specific DNA-methyltransferase (adenine-specific) n=1 Tax=Algoriphagus boritolerans DSM 17298 = JCM 18970 TaxID=1120964 RepID=A0A1H5UBZ9_9BACT|nr:MULTISPECIES: site-specific DNA-methyltransferase [Algoriphagus]MDP2042066.1 site-specific DNA-methyltransferase [Algoriphagus sp.]MDP3474244.1 site-specific DNA-methyltransferase [Algoriphagus sp.]SEF72529.1 adenine-specific DNA-methyltransferase [Algoriphagus boritolerans DSM 17298 = JCM 18970]
MPTLHWIGKEKVINHHLDVPFKVLEHSYGFDNGTLTSTETQSGNKIIHGDNLEALKALLPEYEGQIKCIYIDPPYNTGKDEWKYNDRVDHPRIKSWFDKIVGKEGEDLSRHDKWLCMIYPRLVLLHKLLKDEGVLLVSIDNNELYSLKIVLDEIFGPFNLVGNIIWKNATDNNPTQIANEHEYILCYSKKKTELAPEWKSPNLDVKEKLLNIGKEFVERYSDPEELQIEYTKWFRENKQFLWPFEDYKFIDSGGVYTGSRSVHNPGKEGYRYDVIHPITKKPCKQPLMGYRFPESTLNELIDRKRIIFGEDESKIIELKLYAFDYRAKLSSVIELDGRKGANTIKDVFETTNTPFKNPKTTELIEEILSFTTSKDDVVLDSFSGSGTTAHAVLNLNKQDGGNRRFICIEMEDYAETITAERVKRVINGYGEDKKEVEGTGGSFDFYELGQSLFDEDGNLNESVGLTKIRNYVWYTETKTPLKEERQEDNAHFLGKHNDTSYYFYYESEAITTLDHSFLASIKTKAEQYVIYADNCLLTKEFMVKHHLIFKKIPRDITRF